MLYGGGGGGSSSKKVSLSDIAKTALNTYNNSGKNGRDSNIVKTAKDIFKPIQNIFKKPQQTNKSAGFSYGKKLYQKVVAFDKKYTSGWLDPVTHKDKSDKSSWDKQGGGQFGGITSSINAWREDARPKTISEFAQVAAKADTATDKDVYNYYNKLRTAHGFHDAAISTGQSWMSDQKRVNDWILSAASDEEANARIDQVNKYMNGALHEVPTYDPNTHQYSSQLQFKADADLPPWIPRTKDNLDMWEYYTTYAHDVVSASVQAYNDARDEGREQARNPYKSAFADSEKPGQIDSFLDVIIAGVDPNSVSMTYENIARGTAKYLNEYVWNPIKTGHLKTAAGNALWNLMDTMDVASRGVRGLVAGETALGGSGGKEFKSANSKFDDYYAKTWEKYGVAPSKEYEQNKNHGTWKYRNDATFKGQDVYWAKLEGHSDEEVQKAQQLFMDQGGFNLLLAKFPSTASKTQLASGEIPSTQEEKEAIEKHLDMMFQGSAINWRDIYDDIVQNYYGAPATDDLKKGFENVKKAYTDVDANFQADTGNMASDIIIESVLDPGLIVGGLSKGVAKGTVKSAAQNGIEEGFKAILRNSDDAGTLFNNKNVQRAFKNFINSNEGKNIIFKDAKKFDEDIELFMKRVGKESPIFSTQAAKDDFKRTVTAHLMGKQTSVNGMVIEAQNFARNALDKKTFKAAYYMDKAIDGVDSAIIKSSFFLPWAGIKGAKALGHGVLNSKTLGKISARLTLRKANTMRTIVDEATNKIDVTKIDNLMSEFENGMHYEKDVRSALMQVVDQYDSVAWNINDVIRKFSRGEITDEDALRLVGEYIHDITGGKYRYVQELSGYVDNIAIRYAGDVKSAFGRIDDTFRRLQNLIDRRSANAVDGFLDEVRRAENIDELRVLFREHMDNSYIMALRNQVVDNAQFKLTVDDVDNLVNEVKSGLFSDESVTKDTIRKGVQGQMKMSEKTIRRTVSFGQFDEILESIGVDWRTVLRYDGMDLGEEARQFSSFETKLSNFMAAWMDQPDVTYTIDDALKFVDRLERQIHFKELMQASIPSEVSALSAHKLTGECNKLRKMLKRLDIINLKDVKYVTLPQMDRMAMNLNFRNNQDIQAMYGSFYDDVIDPIWRRFKGKTSDEIDLMDSSLFDDIDQLAKQKYGFDRTSQLIEEAKTLPGFSDDHLHSFLNTLATDFRFRDELGNIDLSPGMLRRKVEATLRAQTGQSKVGMKNITDALTSIDSENPSQFLAPYVDIFKESPELKSRYMRYVETDVLDPRAYVEKQMLFTALADPSVIPEWNSLAAKGQTPVLMHINTTGLNSEINSITSVSFRKWVPIDIPYNEAGSVDNEEFLKRLLDAFDGEETTVIQRRMADSEFDEFTEQVIRQLDIKDSIPENIINRFKSYYGITDNNLYKSENEMMEEACAYIQGLTRQVDDNGALRSVAPTLVVHDLDGFNVNYFNNKIRSMYDPKDTSSAAYDYVTRISKSAKDNSCNTYTRLAEKSGDLYYTDEQLDLITDLLHDYIDDINYYANGYRINDMQSYSRKLHEIIDTLELKKNAGQLTEAEEEFLDMFNNASGSSMLASYDKAIKDITSLGYYPRQYAFLSSGLEDNFTKAALEATGRTSVNVNNRIVVDNVLSYFDIATEDGIYTTVEDLRKMNEMAKYIINTRDRQIVAGAEEFLTPHKAEFDRVIQSVIDLANSNSYEATKLSYLQNMRIPDNAIDSYLMARKLYNDHLKYWLDTDELTSLRTGGKDLDAMKLKLRDKGRQLGFDDPLYELEKDRVFKQACEYVNNNRVRFFDELTGGGFGDNYYESLEELSEKFTEESEAFWEEVSDTQSKMWDDFREYNAAFREQYSERYDKLNKAYEDWRVDKEYSQYLYSIVDEKRARYKTLKDENAKLYKDLLDAFDDLDPRWADYDSNADEMKDILDSINEDWTNAHENYEAYKNNYFKDGKFTLKERSAALKAEKAKAKAGSLHPGWGRKTTQRQINKAVREALQGTSLSASERREAISKIDSAAKEAARALNEGDNKRASEILYDAIDSLIKDLKRLDTDAADASVELRKYLKETSIATDSIKNDITDFGYFRKQHFGAYKLHKDGLEYDKVLEEMKELFPEYFNSYDAEGPSGFFEYVDNILDNSKPKQVDIPDGEKAELRDTLLNQVFDTLVERPGYSVSDTDDNFTEVYNRYVHKLHRPTTYDGVKALSEAEYALATMEYADLARKQRQDLYDNLEKVQSIINTSDETLDLLQGAHEPEIFNWAARSDFEKQVLTYKNGVMKSGLDKAVKYSEAGSQIKSEMRQLQHMDDYFTAAGIARSQDRFTASVYMKSNQLFEILEQGGFLKRESFHEFLQKASDLQRLHLQDYRFRALRNSEGVFDSDKLLSELVYNGFNMSVFNSHNYSPKEMKELRKFIKDLQTKYNFISYYEDRTTGNVFIYLNNNAEIAEADGMRWINKTMKFERPVHDVIPFAEFDELVDMLDIDDIEDFRGVYSHLKSCWEDTRLLSFGQINGTTGRTVSRRQAEGFLQSLPSNMNDWLTSEGLLRDEMVRGIIYDPGFVINDQSDMLTDFLGTLQRQAETAKDDAIIVNEVFHSNGSVHFNELASNFSDEELIRYFGENPEYIVCTIVGNEKTATGLQIKQLNLSNRMGLEAAKNTPNTTILPYNTYCELSNYMNREVADDNIYKQLLGKYMLVYKAFALVRPGTWMRNFIDATTKAAFDNGNGVENVFSMLQYEGKAARDIGTYGQILKSDASLLTPANWDIVQRTFKTDMTYEDFELLRGVMDSDRFKSADKYFLSRTTRQRGGFNIISGENIGLRNLEYDDISAAYEKYLSKEFDLPLSKKEFLDIYTGDVIPDEAVNEQFEDMFRKLSNNMRNSNASTIFDKTIDTMFKPFGTVEELVRYAQTLSLRDNGFSQNQITRHIHNTQFYSAPVSGAWRKLENIMPFITFKFNNMMYWVRMMDENPRLYRLFEDMYRSVYDTTLESALEEGVELDYESDYGLQSGGIPIGNGKRYFNMGSSFLSAMNDFYGLPHDIDSLNPLIRDSVRASMYALGLNSKQFFSTVNLELTDEQVMQTVESAVPGLTLAKKAAKTFKTISGICSESGGPTMEVLCTTLDFLGITGSRYQYKNSQDGKFSFDEWQDELAAQGKWYDANLGKIVDIAQKNEFGANDPNNSFKDVQTYMLVHFGKVWDANQCKFVSMSDYQEGGYNNGFDSFEDVCEYMKLQGKVWDANQRKFVYPSERIGGGLNNRDQEWETVVALMEEHFPNLKWDANQQTFVEKQYYISGGLNDVHNFREVMSLRKALYGETYNRNLHKFEVTEDPSIVTMDSFMEIGKRKDYDDYFALLAIPRMWSSDKRYYVDNEGLFRTSDGKYIVTGNAEHDAKVFEKFKHDYDYTGRSYNGYKNYSYNKTRSSGKPYKGRYTGSTAYQTGYGWNEEYGYYREAFEYSYQYHSPQPGNKLNRLISPPIHYPYGGGYNKFSFHNRY